MWVDDTRLDIFEDHTSPNYPQASSIGGSSSVIAVHHHGHHHTHPHPQSVVGCGHGMGPPHGMVAALSSACSSTEDSTASQLHLNLNPLAMAAAAAAAAAGTTSNLVTLGHHPGPGALSNSVVNTPIGPALTFPHHPFTNGANSSSVVPSTSSGPIQGPPTLAGCLSGSSNLGHQFIGHPPTLPGALVGGRGSGGGGGVPAPHIHGHHYHGHHCTAAAADGLPSGPAPHVFAQHTHNFGGSFRSALGRHHQFPSDVIISHHSGLAPTLFTHTGPGPGPGGSFSDGGDGTHFSLSGDIGSSGGGGGTPGRSCGFLSMIGLGCLQNRCVLALLFMVLLPLGLTTTLIWAFKVQRHVNHESAIIAFMVFCFAFVFPFVLFFAAVVGHKIYKIYLIIKRHEEIQRHSINNGGRNGSTMAAAAAAAVPGSTTGATIGGQSSSILSSAGLTPYGGGGGGHHSGYQAGDGTQGGEIRLEEDPPPTYEAAILCARVDLNPKDHKDARMRKIHGPSVVPTPPNPQATVATTPPELPPPDGGAQSQVQVPRRFALGRRHSLNVAGAASKKEITVVPLDNLIQESSMTATVTATATGAQNVTAAGGGQAGLQRPQSAPDNSHSDELGNKSIQSSSSSARTNPTAGRTEANTSMNSDLRDTQLNTAQMGPGQRAATATATMAPAAGRPVSDDLESPPPSYKDVSLPH